MENINKTLAALNGAKTADEIGALELAMKSLLDERNAKAKADKIGALVKIAEQSKMEFWTEFLAHRDYPHMSCRKNKNTQEYSLSVTAKSVAFNSVNSAYKKAGAENEKRDLAENIAYYRALSHFTHNIIRVMGGEIETATKFTLNEKAKSEIAGVDFGATSIGKMELQANAVMGALLPAEIIGEIKIYKADIRHLIHIADSKIKVDFESANRDGHIKTANENVILNELLSVLTVKMFGGKIYVDSKARAHKENKSTTKKETEATVAAEIAKAIKNGKITEQDLKEFAAEKMAAAK